MRLSQSLDPPAVKMSVHLHVMKGMGCNINECYSERRTHEKRSENLESEKSYRTIKEISSADSFSLQLDLIQVTGIILVFKELP